MKYTYRIVVLAAVLLLISCSGNHYSDKNPLYKDAKQPVEKRVQDLLKRMTPEEKTAQLICFEAVPMEKMPEVYKNGVGEVPFSCGLNNSPREVAEFNNRIQKFLLEKTRLGIPAIMHAEATHGYCGLFATNYPHPPALGATFDPALIERIFSHAAREARSCGIHQALAPELDVVRELRWSRTEETFGEDPYLTSRMAVATVRGFQGDRTFKDKQHIIATLKHFAAHGQPEGGHNQAPVNVSERELRDVFLVPFKAAVTEAHALSAMASYNEINSIPSHANHWLLDDVLRKEWKFDGFVVSDYSGINMLAAEHTVAADMNDAACLAIKAGVDVDLPDGKCYKNIPDLLKKGKLEQAIVDTAVARVLKVKFMMGLFDDPYVDVDKAEEIAGNKEDDSLALQAAREGMILLKNNNAVPLDPEKIKTIAVIGPNANSFIMGNYSDVPRKFVTVLDGIKNNKELLEKGIKVVFAQGTKITTSPLEDRMPVGLTHPEKVIKTHPLWWWNDTVQPSTKEQNMSLVAKAVEAARKADVIVVAIGGNIFTGHEGCDQSDLKLLGMQNELVQELHKLKKPIIALVFGGQAYDLSVVNDNVDALFYCWYLGQETGNAVADVLLGNVSPSGRLTFSLPRSVGHLPVYYNHKAKSRMDYYFTSGNPLYEFGYGLSYSTFLYSNMRIEKDHIKNGDNAIVSVDVKNTGKYKADEVVQLYIHDMVSSVTRPVKELKDFRRITLKPGETNTLRFEIPPDKLSFYNIDMKFVVEPGEFHIGIGPSSLDKDLLVKSLWIE